MHGVGLLIDKQETAACIGAVEQLRGSGWLAADARVVICNCGSGRKYPHLMRGDLPRLSAREPWDWTAIAAPAFA